MYRVRPREPGDARFCEECAGELSRVCAGCGTPNTPVAKFCKQCRAVLTDAGGSASSPSAPQPAPLPSSFASGRYNVRRLLGEGGKKRVYLAHDTRLDRDVAFALIKTDGLDADGLVRVRREAQAMGRLGDHPHIVTIFDTGDEGGAPYIVSQYRGGGSVEDVLAKADQHRIAPERAMKIAEQVCFALQHAHGRGIVHRDLKPGNVWLADDGNAALGDFGLAIAIDRSRMTMAGMMVGTVAYMAPEQALGRTPDARSDLYALGAMLYEMVTGRPPFLGDDAVGMISQHINTAPVAPSWHNPEVPKPLEALILRLLAKSPDRRPASAQEVAQELRRILERTTEEPPRAPQPQAVTDLRALAWGMFVGRRDEMDQLKDALEGALSAKGSLATIVGEPGIGKTRLAEEFAVYAELRGAQVLTGRCYEGEASLPYRPFVEAFRQYTRSRPDDELRMQMGPGAPEIATLVSEVRRRFPDIEEAPRLDPEAERLRLFESVTEFLRNAAADPLVLFLDDLHWADKPSLLMLQHLAQRTARDRLLIVGAYRDVELDRQHPLSEALGALRRIPNFRRVLLRGLPQETIEDLLAIIEPSEEVAAERQALAGALYQETEGNPFFIREVLAHLIETGKIVHENGRWVGRVTTVSELGIPEGVREVIGRRLSRLSTGCNRMLTLASTMTGGFSWEALKAINAGVPEAELLDLLEEALRAQLIAERKGDAAGTYDFTHALIRQTLYDELSTPRRVLLHRQIGETLEQLYAGNVDAHLPELAHHFYQAAPGGDVGKAIDYARRAGDRAVSLVAWEEAVANYERALQAMDLMAARDYAAWVELMIALGDAQTRGGAGTAAAETLRKAIDVAEHLDDPASFARAALAYADAIFSSPEAFAATALAGPVLARALKRIGPEDSPLRAKLLGALANIDVAERLERAREAVAMAGRTGDVGAIIATQRWLLNALSGPGLIAEHAKAAKQFIALATRSGSKADELWGRMHLMIDHLTVGDIDAVDAELQRLFPLSQETREPLYMGWRPFWLGMRASMQGKWVEAEEQAREMLIISQRFQLPVYFQSWGAVMYDVRRHQGRLPEIDAPLQVAAQQAGGEVWNPALVVLYCEAGRTDDARRLFDQVAANDFTDLVRDNIWTTKVHLLVYAAQYLGDERRARLLYDLLLPYRGQMVVVGFAILCAGSVSTPLGIAATVLEEWEAAEDHFEEALEMERRSGARPWHARTELEYAVMLHQRDRAAEREKAAQLVSSALVTFEELGMKKELERALALKLDLQDAMSSGLYTSIDAVTRAVEHERPEISVHPAPDGTVTIMFSDIEDSTVLTERLGDQRWQELLHAHNAIIREQVRAHTGFEVKTIGDGFMVAFQSARKALDCAIATQRAFAREGSLSEPVRVRIGLHAGEAIREADDFYGKNVIMASRVAGSAKGGEILVSALLRQLVESTVEASIFCDPRHVELKGLSGAHTLYPVAWQDG